MQRFEGVALKDIGTILVQYSPAAFKNNRSSLSPPYHTLSFTREYIQKFDLSGLLHKYHPNTDADKTADTINEKINLDLNATGSSDLEHIGILKKEGEGYSFMPDTTQFNGNLWGLPAIEVRAVPAAHERNIASDLLSKKTAPDQPLHFKDERTPASYFVWPLLAVLLTIILLGLRYVSCNAGQSQDKEVPGMVADTPEIKPDTNVLSDSVPAITDSITASDTNTAKDQVLPEIKGFDGECIIIVGSFARESNAKRMFNRINSAGYKVYYGKNNGMVRVGMTFECNEDDLSDSMKSMRSKFSRDAWYLKPQIRMEN